MADSPGSYIIDEDGTLKPNLDDEAMAERERLKITPPPSGEEVSNDG
jgi:hypothetical protein